MNPNPTNPQPSAAAMRAAKIIELECASALPALVRFEQLATLIHRETGLDEVLAVLKEVEWNGPANLIDICPCCYMERSVKSNHNPTCRLAQLIARLDNTHQQEKP